MSLLESIQFNDACEMIKSKAREQIEWMQDKGSVEMMLMANDLNWFLERLDLAMTQAHSLKELAIYFSELHGKIIYCELMSGREAL